jgi:HPt (histidine-containing phosphotransfer) domain-containing protein
MNVLPSDLGNDPEFDAAVLLDLVEGDPAEFQKFALMFISSFETALTNMDIARASDDMAVLGAMGHRAKTTARNIGAMALGQECELLENSVEASNFDEARRMAAGVRPLFEGVRSALLRCINPPHNGL